MTSLFFLFCLDQGRRGGEGGGEGKGGKEGGDSE